MKPTLRKWTKETLVEEDYAFAVSNIHASAAEWSSPAQQLWKSKAPGARQLVTEFLDHELCRELNHSKLDPFFSLEGSQQRLDELLQNESAATQDVPPLIEVPLEQALERNARLQHPADALDDGTRVFAFEIARDEPTDVTGARFRKWLVGERQKTDPRDREVEAANRAAKAGTPALALPVTDFKRRLNQLGRRSYDACLCALAVYRLKEAGFRREEVERKLNLKRGSLRSPTDRWGKLPAIAHQLRQRQLEIERQVMRPSKPAAGLRWLSSNQRKKEMEREREQRSRSPAGSRQVSH